MATAEELLARSTSSDDKVCVIDWDTRVINIPKSIITLGVESDDNVKRLYFRMPKTYRGTDLSDFSIRINYINANDDSAYFAPATDVNVDNASNTITFYWDVGRDVVAYKGDVKFIVCLKHSGADDIVDQELNTTLATLPVLEGLEADMESIQIEPVDYLSQLLAVKNAYRYELDNLGFKCTENLGEKYEELEGKLSDTATALTKTVGEPYRSRANAIVKSAEGETIFVHDASDDYLRDLRVFGKSTQATTTGKNLLSSGANGSSTSSGFYITKKDGSFTITGTGSATNACAIHFFGEDTILTQPFKVGKTYTYGVFDLTGSTNQLYFQINYMDTTGKEYALVSMDQGILSKTFTVPDNFEKINNIYIGWMYTENPGAVNCSFRLQVEEGSVATTWEPYSGGCASPSPDWEQPITSIETPTLTILGKNLLDVSKSKTDLTNASNWASIAFDTATVRQTLRPSTTYTMRFKATSIKAIEYASVHSYRLGFGLFDFDTNKYVPMATSGDIGVGSWLNNGSSVDIVGTFTTPANLFDLNYQIIFYTQRAKLDDETSVSNTINFTDIQIEYSDAATDYAPYSAHSIQCTCTLPGIPVTSGGNYTDANGQQYVCDEIDFERGVYIQRIGQYTFTGVNDDLLWVNTVDDADETTVKHFFSGALTTLANLKYPNVMCPTLKYDLVAGAYNTTSVNVCKINTSNGNLLIDMDATACPTITNLKTLMAENPMTISYILATPIETPLTEAELAAYSELHSNYPTTTVMNDQGAHMKLKYNADTRIYVGELEQKIQELERQLQEAESTQIIDLGCFTHTTGGSIVECNYRPSEVLELFESGKRCVARYQSSTYTTQTSSISQSADSTTIYVTFTRFSGIDVVKGDISTDTWMYFKTHSLY